MTLLNLKMRRISVPADFDRLELAPGDARLNEIIEDCTGRSLFDGSSSSLSTSPKAMRGQGLGEQLMRIAEESFAEKVLHRYLAGDPQLSGIRVYRKRGYSEFGRLADIHQDIPYLIFKSLCLLHQVDNGKTVIRAVDKTLGRFIGPASFFSVLVPYEGGCTYTLNGFRP